MSKLFKRVLFGFKPAEVENEINRLGTVYRDETSSLQADIDKAKTELKKSEEEITALQAQLKELASREQSIIDVMVLAQKKALQVEEDARRQGKIMLETAERELQDKKKELEGLQERLGQFKEEFKELLDDYRFSVENIGTLPREISHGLTLLDNEKPLQAPSEALCEEDLF